MRVMRTLLALSLLEVGQPTPEAHATTLVLVKTESIARAADRVVHGVVIATEARWQRGRIVTRVRMRPADGAPDLWFEHPGGTVEDVTMKVLGMPDFRPGERTVVLLKQRAGQLRLVGLSEGKLAVVSRAGRDVVYVRLRDNGPLEPVELDDALPRLATSR
jgi:hypothetical protein